MRRTTVALLALLCAGCLTGPDYQRPPVEAPPSFRYELDAAAVTTDTAWWQQLGDPVLDALVAEALANNKNVKIAAANVAQAAAVFRESRSQLYPQAGGGASAGRAHLSEAGAAPFVAELANPSDSYELAASASWEIDLWGRVRPLNEAAQAGLLASEEAKRGVVLSLVGAVAAGYVQLRALDEQLLIARRTQGTYAESVALFQLQFEHGFKPQMTVEQARVQYETASAKIPQLEAQVAQTEHALSLLLGRDPGPVARGRGIAELTLPAVPAGLPAELLERRPDLRQAEQNLVALNAQLGATKARYFPTISLTGALGLASAELDGLFGGDAEEWSWGGSLVGPLFTGGAIAAQVRQVEAAREAALVAYQAAIQAAFADVADALVARAKLSEQSAAQERLVHASREYARLARLQFDGGVTPYFTVLQAEQQLFPAELELVAVRAALLVSLVDLYKAMGGGWVSAAEAATVPAPAVATPPAVLP